MKKQFRILAAALALCLSLLCCPAAFAAVDSSSCQTVPYAQATSQPLGQPITITGTPNYSAATSNDTAFIFGFDTADGVWYVAVQKSKFDAFKAAAPAQQMTLYGVYAGTLDVNGMPILDIQNGSVLLNGTTSDTTALYTAGQKKLDAQKAAAAASRQGTTRFFIVHHLAVSYAQMADIRKRRSAGLWPALHLFRLFTYFRWK